MEDVNILGLLLSLVFTVILYMSVPLLIKYIFKVKNYNSKLICIINSIVIFIIISIIKYLLENQATANLFLPFLFCYINYSILSKKEYDKSDVSRYDIQCKVCGKTIPYNEYGTCEECHQMILKRMQEKQNEDNYYKISNDNQKDIKLENNISDDVENETKKDDNKIEYTIEKCPNCNEFVQKNWKFCKYCGCNLLENRTCPNCNEKIDINWKFCKNCGYKIDFGENDLEKINSIKKEKKSLKNNKKLLVIIILIIIFSVMAGSIIFEYDFNDLKNIIVTKKIEDVKESIVKVVVYNNDNEELATGSGVCVFDNNMIITNFHVIEGASKIQIITNAKETYNINKINAFNKKQDIALISGNFNLQPIAIGNVNHIAVGQNITAIGSPEGQLNTMSTGIISNIDNDYDIGISTPISPGSSGGALLNKKNQLIGITYATYNSSDAQNLNYAINVNYVKRIYNAYKNDECKIISDSKVSNFVKELEYSDTFENSLFYYYVDSFSTWKTLTDDETKFSNFLMSQENGQILQGIFTSFSTEERYTIIKLYKEMTEYESKSLRDISNISVYDAILDTNIISKYEFAMIIDDYSNSNNIENIINKYPMQTGEDIFLRLVYGNLKHLSNSQYNKLSKFIFNNCSNNAQIAWFTLFGYEISYDTNGNVKSVTWYY